MVRDRGKWELARWGGGGVDMKGRGEPKWEKAEHLTTRVWASVRSENKIPAFAVNKSITTWSAS